VERLLEGHTVAHVERDKKTTQIVEGGSRKGEFQSVGARGGKGTFQPENAGGEGIVIKFIKNYGQYSIF